MKLYKMLVVLVIGMCSFDNLSAYNVRISQIDPSTMLYNQYVKLYVSVTDENGKPVTGLDRENFELFESGQENSAWKTVPLISMKSMVNYEEGISFVLLVDNSGSMYKSVDGKSKETRIDHAKSAIKEFIAMADNPRDRISVASYNTYYTEHTSLDAEKSESILSLGDIAKPEGDEGYTEIFASLTQALESLANTEGRKVVIVLSDGENRPFTQFTGKQHPEYGDKIYSHSEALEICQREGVSLFSIHYGTSGSKKDHKLQEITIDSGGAVFHASNGEELEHVYSHIVNLLLHEYRLISKASMIPADRRYVKLMLKNADQKLAADKKDEESYLAESVRFYFASTLFGMPLRELTPLILMPLLLAAILLFLLSKMKFEKTEHEPMLELFDRGGAKEVTKSILLGNGRTVIGGTTADMTIAGGVTRVKECHANILYDTKKQSYTLVSEGDVAVNNKRVKNKVLESGDLIDVDGTKIIFDNGAV